MKRILRPILMLIVATVGLGVVLYGCCCVLYPKKYADEIASLSEEFGVDESLIYAVVCCESGFDPDAVSAVGAKGLMQLTPAAFEWTQTKLDGETTYDDSALFDPEVNLRYGVYLLKLHLEEFGSPEVALAAYHAGRGRVNEWLADSELSPDGENLAAIPYADTSSYVQNVIKTERIYRILY